MVDIPPVGVTASGFEKPSEARRSLDMKLLPQTLTPASQTAKITNSVTGYGFPELLQSPFTREVAAASSTLRMD